MEMVGWHLLLIEGGEILEFVGAVCCWCLVCVSVCLCACVDSKRLRV